MMEELPFLDRRDLILDMNPSITPKMKNKIDHSWRSGEKKNAIIKKNPLNGWSEAVAQFTADADFSLIQYAIMHGAAVVTEETDKDNDNKVFHKIPKICRMENSRCMNAMEFLHQLGIEACFRIKS